MAKKGGKYAAVCATLPREALVDPDRQAIVERVKVEILAPVEMGDSRLQSFSIENLLDDAAVPILDIITVMKRTTAGKPWASEFARAYAELRKVKETIAEWQSNVQLLIDVYESMMVEQMEVEGVSGLKLANGQPVSWWFEPHAKVVDEQALRAWCLKDADLSRKMRLMPATVESITRQRLLEGEAPPDGVEVTSRVKVRLGAE